MGLHLARAAAPVLVRARPLVYDERMIAAASSLDVVFTIALWVAAGGFVLGALMFGAARAGRRSVQGAMTVMSLSLVVYLLGGVAGAAVRARSAPETPMPAVADETPIAQADAPEPTAPVAAEPTTPAPTPAPVAPTTPTPTPAPAVTPTTPPPPPPPPAEAAPEPEPKDPPKKKKEKKKKKKKDEGDEASGEYMDEDAPSLPKDTKPAEPEDELKPLSPKPADKPEPKDEPKAEDEGPKTPSGFGDGG